MKKQPVYHTMEQTAGGSGRAVVHHVYMISDFQEGTYNEETGFSHHGSGHGK